MAELSRPWSGIVTGDAGPYSDDQWTDVWKTLLGPVIASEGVFIDQLNELNLSGLPVSPVDVETGRALVDGAWYESNTTVSVAVPTPAANPRVDRIVLRKDWALQTVRITRIAGAEAAAPVPPALTQADGVTWDLPLWQVFITVGGVISVYRDERDFIGQYAPVGLTDVDGYYEDDFPYFDYIAGETRGQWEVTAGGIGISVPNLGGFGEANLRNDTNNTITALRGCAIDPTDRDAIMRTRQYTLQTDAVLFVRAGWLSALPSQATPDPLDGIYFRHNGAGNWFAVCRAGGVETAVDTTLAPAAAWRIFEIHVKAAVVTFIIDGVVRATITTNIPAVALSHIYGVANSAGPAGITSALQLDWTKARGTRG